MDEAFSLDEAARSKLFRSIMQSLRCVYACLWSYFSQPVKCLISLDGYYNEAEDQPSTSSGSLARRRFEEYRKSFITLEDEHVPGLAFRNSQPYVEIMRPEIQRLANNDTQWLFYEEAGIQTVVFMGCKSGEIELGFSSNTTQMNVEMALREWFPEDFPRKSPVQPEFLPNQTDQSRPLSSSSSSLRSLDSPNISEYSPLVIFPNINPSTSQKLPESCSFTQTPLLPITSSMNIQGHALAQIREREEEAMTRAILAVLTSPSSASSSSSSSQQKSNKQQLSPKPSAFKRYHRSGAVGPTASLRKQSMIKRAISYYHSLNPLWRERLAVGSRGGPTTTQLHHMMSERKRREKLNESFQALRLLLPQGTKKDKASVLATARDELTSMQSEISKLIQRNREMEAKLVGKRELERLSSDQMFNVRLTNISESTSEGKIVDLRVVFRGENFRVDDLVIRLLGFLKLDRTVSLMSIEARTRIEEEGRSSSAGLVSLRLKIEGEWDESAFLEAVRRVIADMPH